MRLIPPEPGTLPLAAAVAAARLQSLTPGWRVEERKGVLRLCKEYPTPDFQQAMALASCVADLAATANHHPVLEIGWGRLSVQWWTHSLRGLHGNDFLMAAACDGVIADFMQNSGAQ